MSSDAEKLLHRLLDRCDALAQQDRHREVQLNRRQILDCLPELDTGDQDDAELLHSHLQAYADKGWIKLLHAKGRAASPASLVCIRLADGMETTLRMALARPAPGTTERERQWQAGLTLHLPDLPTELRNALLRNPIALPHRPPVELAERLARAGTLLGQGFSVREASAQAFWGHSKLLDGRGALITALCGNASALPVALQVRVPASWRSVLWIENEASFVRACLHAEARYSSVALAFCSGYRGAARRLTAPFGSRLFASPDSDAEGLGRFHQWLTGGRHADTDCAFFGDLDFSGMGILRELRQTLPHTVAWRPGYTALLARLNSDGGHTLEEGGTGGQTDPVTTGCSFADEQLLVALRRSGHTVDQEAFDWNLLSP